MLLVHRVPVQFPSGKGNFVWMAWSVVVAFGNRHVAINTHTLTNDVLWMGGLKWHITYHDDVTKWKHFLRYWPCVQGNSPVTGPWLTAPSHHIKERTQHFTAADDTTLTCCTIQTAVSHLVSFRLLLWVLIQSSRSRIWRTLLEPSVARGWNLDKLAVYTLYTHIKLHLMKSRKAAHSITYIYIKKREPNCACRCPSTKRCLPISRRSADCQIVSSQVRTDSRIAPSQWETSLQSNAVSHWLGAKLESALQVPWLQLTPLSLMTSFKMSDKISRNLTPPRIV